MLWEACLHLASPIIIYGQVASLLEHHQGVGLSSLFLMTYPYSYYHNQALSLHHQWVNNLKEIKEITSPESRKLWIDDLRFLHSQVTQLVDAHKLAVLDQALLLHISDRTIEEHLALVRASSSQLIAGF